MKLLYQIELANNSIYSLNDRYNFLRIFSFLNQCLLYQLKPNKIIYLLHNIHHLKTK